MTAVIKMPWMMSPRTNGSDRLSLWLAIALAMHLAVNAVLMVVAPDGYGETVLAHTWELVRGVGSDDSWGPLYLALQRYRTDPGASIYKSLFFGDGVRYQYPPSALFALWALQWVAPGRVRIDDQLTVPWPAINDLVSWAFVLATLVATLWFVEIKLRDRFGSRGSRLGMGLRWLAITGLILTFYPVCKAYSLGQIQVWLNGLLALALLAWTLGYRSASGVLVGIACLVKPHYVLFAIWAVIRRETAFVGGLLTVGTIGLLAAVAVFGVQNHLDYASVLSFLSQRGEAYYPNQSINGLLNRALLIGVDPPTLILNFTHGEFAPFSPIVYGGTLLASAVLLSAALVRGRSERGGDRSLDFARMLLTITLASPIAWEHHYGVLPPIIATLAFCVHGRHRFALLVASSWLAAMYLPITQELAATRFNVLQSYLLAAALALLALLHWPGQRGVRGATDPKPGSE